MESNTEGTGETNETALIVPEHSLELCVGAKAVQKLREDLELTHPKLETLFFVPQDFAVFYSINATLKEIGDSVTKEEYNTFFIESLIQYFNESAEIQQRTGIFAKLRGEDKHLFIGRDKLDSTIINKLSGQVYDDIFSEQIRTVDEIRSTFDFRQYSDGKSWKFTTPLQEKLERLIKESHSFIRNFSIVPVNESAEHTSWESVIPVEEMTNVLGGLLYESKRVKPFKASGEIFSESKSENVMPQYTLLDSQYGAVLSDKLFMLFEDFNKDFKGLVGRLAQFVKKETKLPQDLQINIALYNCLVNGLHLGNGDQLSGSYVAGISMALRGINGHLKDVFSSIENFRLPSITSSLYGLADSIKEKTGFELIERKRYSSDYTARKPLK